jgi:hypothetical protein
MNIDKQAMIDYMIHQDVFNGLYYAILLGGEFSNCHGQGLTPDEAIASLKIRVGMNRRGDHLSTVPNFNAGRTA